MLKYSLKIMLLVLGINVFSVSVQAEVKGLASELAVFEPYLGTWQADFPVAEGQAPMQDVSRWERALNGTAIRTLHSINNGMYGGESLIFWDKSQNSVVFYYFTTAGFYTQGRIDILESGEFVAYEEVTGSQEGITQVKSTSRLDHTQMHVATQYLKNGQWTDPELRTYQRSTLPVVFK